MQRFLLALLIASLCVFASCAPLTSFFTPKAFKTRIEGDGVVIVDFLDNRATSVVIPAKIDGRPVVKIDEGAFCSLPLLTSFAVSSDNPRFQAVDGALFTADGKTLIAFPAGKKTTKYAIPDGVEAVGAYAFACCLSLTSVEIPASVETIGESPFHLCLSLTSFAVSSDNPRFKTVDDVLFAADGKTLTAFPAGKETTKYVIPDCVETVGAYAFSSCDLLTSVEIPASVKTIGAYAFAGCDLLTSVEIPDSVETIGDGAFYACDSLTSVEIPASVKTIGEEAFNNCDSLTSVEIPASVETIGKSAFYFVRFVNVGRNSQ